MTRKAKRCISRKKSAPDWQRQACLEMADGEPLLFVDGHDEAILGMAEVDGEPRVVYDQEEIVHALMRRDDMDREGAVEFFEYNIAVVACGAPQALFVLRVR